MTEGALTKRTSLSLPPKISIEEWGHIGRKIFVISESSTWWLGDWLIYGQAHYPDRYMRAIEKTQLDYQTLRNYAWVARRYPVARRRPNLSFQHHAELASLPEDQREEWLDRAEKFAWSRNTLRNRLKASRHSLPNPDKRGLPSASLQNIAMSVAAERKQRWQDAAQSRQQDLEAWMLNVLDSAAANAQAAEPDQLSQRRSA
ncbi:LmbU family transcriptional regulator [Streptomyces sp. MN03-5084-2B]|nr:LmbU family transcriptional regulator [Streptomyces sp. MN03-5084-2B]